MEKILMYCRVGNKDQVNDERVDCGNHFTEDKFDDFCKVLEEKGTACVYIDCAGYSRNNHEQEIYKKHLEEKYGDRLVVEREEGVCSYYYKYTLKEVG